MNTGAELQLGSTSSTCLRSALSQPSLDSDPVRFAITVIIRSDRKTIFGDRQPVPTIIFHGDRDMTVHPNNGGQILEQSVRTMATQKKVHHGHVPGGHTYTRTVLSDASGCKMLEHWNIHGAGHAWSGGSPAGSYTDPAGPDATREILRFFLEHSLPAE
jgi:poly(3-hydroxybutyrate) depolymerase